MLKTNTPSGPVVVRKLNLGGGLHLRVVSAERWLPPVTYSFAPTGSRDPITEDTNRFRESLTGEMLYLPYLYRELPQLRTEPKTNTNSNGHTTFYVVDRAGHDCTPIHRFSDAAVFVRYESYSKRSSETTTNWTAYGPIYTDGPIKRCWLWNFRRITGKSGERWYSDPLAYIKFVSDAGQWYIGSVNSPPLNPRMLYEQYGTGNEFLFAVRDVAVLMEPTRYYYVSSSQVTNYSYSVVATYEDVNANVRVFADNCIRLFREHTIPRSGGFVYELFHADDPRYHPEVIHCLGQLATGMANDIRYADVNTTMLIKEIIDIIKDPRAAVKVDHSGLLRLDIANNFLKWKYGIRLTWSDLKEVWSTLIGQLIDPDQPTNGFMVGRSRQSFTETTQILGREYIRQRRYTGKVFYLPYDADFISMLQRRLLDWELIPDIQNLWDYVPYSFVVDWFIDVGGFFESIDNRNYFAKLPIQSAEYGIYHSIAGPVPDGDWASGFLSASILYEYYNRWIQKTLILPPLELAGGTGGTKNIPEALALIVQRATRL